MALFFSHCFQLSVSELIRYNTRLAENRGVKGRTKYSEVLSKSQVHGEVPEWSKGLI